MCKAIHTNMVFSLQISLELIQLLPCALNDPIYFPFTIQSNHLMHVWGWWRKSPHVGMEAWVECTSLKVMSLVRSTFFYGWKLCWLYFHHSLISFESTTHYYYVDLHCVEFSHAILSIFIIITKLGKYHKFEGNFQNWGKINVYRWALRFDKLRTFTHCVLLLTNAWEAMNSCYTRFLNIIHQVGFFCTHW